MSNNNTVTANWSQYANTDRASVAAKIGAATSLSGAEQATILDLAVGLCEEKNVNPITVLLNAWTFPRETGNADVQGNR